MMMFLMMMVIIIIIIIVGLGLLIVKVLRSETHHTREDSSGKGIGPSQKPPLDNTQESHETDIYASERI